MSLTSYWLVRWKCPSGCGIFESRTLLQPKHPASCPACKGRGTQLDACRGEMANFAPMVSRPRQPVHTPDAAEFQINNAELYRGGRRRRQ